LRGEGYSVYVDYGVNNDPLYGTQPTSRRIVATEDEWHRYIIPVANWFGPTVNYINIGLKNPGDAGGCSKKLFIDGLKFRQYNSPGAWYEVPFSAELDSTTRAEYALWTSALRNENLLSTSYDLEQNFFIHNELSPIYGILAEFGQTTPFNYSGIAPSTWGPHKFDYIVSSSDVVDFEFDTITYNVFNPWNYICNPFNEYLFDGFIMNYIILQLQYNHYASYNSL
jgi:hypothetical protein